VTDTHIHTRTHTDRQTDRQTDRETHNESIYRASLLSRGRHAVLGTALNYISNRYYLFYGIRWVCLVGVSSNVNMIAVNANKTFTEKV